MVDGHQVHPCQRTADSNNEPRTRKMNLYGDDFRRVLTLSPERRPPARRLCMSPKQGGRAGGRRSASLFPHWR
jgi:hypothetical protein